MSNEIMQEDFFASKEIPMCEKVGIIALLLGGTYDENALSPDGKDKYFVSMVYRGGKK